LTTRVVELTVHGLDLARALGVPPCATVKGRADTVATLEGLLGIRAPSALAWDEVTFVEKGTGRESADWLGAGDPRRARGTVSAPAVTAALPA
jgi:hypothetical protein